MRYLKTIPTSNSKHTIANTITVIIQAFIPLLGLVTMLFNVFIISANITTTIVCKIYWEFARFHWKAWLEVKV